MAKTINLSQLIDGMSDGSSMRSVVASADYFDEHILSYQDEGRRVWRSVSRRYANKERDFLIPYSLAESVKLYAIDSLSIVKPLVKNKDDVFRLSEFFTVFYLIVHFFDDHVEHRDKFYSKFDFIASDDLDSQRGAAPFSFMLVSLSIIYDILTEITELSASSRDKIVKELHNALALQTQYFASERKNNLDIEEILEIKQRQVSGKTLSFLGDTLAEYLCCDPQRAEDLSKGLLYLGSLTQITDDIRDQSIDLTLRNANIVISAHRRFGTTSGNAKLSEIFNGEAKLAEDHLAKFYNKRDLSCLLSLPFYPFMISKQQLKESK